MSLWKHLKLTPDELYEIEERAAIHEFDGRLPRSEAEQRALQEFRANRGMVVQAHLPMG